MNKENLLAKLDQLHTTKLGVERIQRNLGITDDAVLYCKSKILDQNCHIYKRGKNWYCEVENIRITVNSYTYTIITAHNKK